MKLLVVGTGLIGTSVGLALRDSWTVFLADLDLAVLRVAVARGAGVAWTDEQVDLVLVCTPPAAVASTVEAYAGVGRTYSHVASIQSQVQRSLDDCSVDSSAVCGGHPLAGRETAGPESAAADLFLGRPWVLCPSSATSPVALEDVRALAAACGAQPVVMDAASHDRTVALVSHLPQVAASAVAARLLDGSGIEVSGPGLQDTTRVAGSDPDLWVEVLTANAAYVAPLVRALALDLASLAGALDDPAAVRDLLERGNRGRALVPVKRGEKDASFTRVSVQVSDEPGQLVALLSAAADVNVEDLRVEHLPGRPTGVVDLVVHVDDGPRLAVLLGASGFAVLTRR
ncbi:MAG: Prephenate dehydrogenase-like protein [Frankiales bacterium]|nr:Prephenate dehydrogenase-like protein [Frankiales bacterium]